MSKLKSPGPLVWWGSSQAGGATGDCSQKQRPVCLFDFVLETSSEAECEIAVLRKIPHLVVSSALLIFLVHDCSFFYFGFLLCAIYCSKYLSLPTSESVCFLASALFFL